MRRSYNMRERFLIFVLLICAGKSDSLISSDPVELPLEVPVELHVETNFAESENAGRNERQSDADTGHYFRVITDMQNQSLISGGKAQFRCKVEGFPMDNVKFTWYKGHKVIDPSDDHRMTIRQKTGMSRLQIVDVFTADSGLYRCEASNGYRRVATEAYLKVSFNLPPPPGEGEEIENQIPSGKCEPYRGLACATYLAGRYVYTDPYQKQDDVERSISMALNRITDPNIVSQSCQRYAIPALCYFVFPVCENADDVTSIIRGKPTAEERATRLCREDCELLKHDVCKNEFMNTEDDLFMEQLVATANCSQLPRTTAKGSRCLKVGLRSIINKEHTCYNDTGDSYMGTSRKTLSGITCRSWPSSMVQKFIGLSGGHNFCRNPGNIEKSPWCFVDEARRTKEICDIKKCAVQTHGSDLITILVPSVAIPVVIGCFGLVFFLCCRGKNKSNKGIAGKQIKGNGTQSVEMTLAPTKNISKVPQVNPSSLHFTMDLGDGQFGKVYKAQLLQNMSYNTNFPVAVKTLNEGATKGQIEEFQRDTEVFADLQHPNVACMKALVVQPNRRCMVFEYTNRVDLHEYLSLHSPHSDVGTKISSSASSQTSSSLETIDFINMMTQIASGMDYLSSSNFIHRDLAARNILVCQNNVLKICNLGVVRDCYLSSYYRSPQGGHMLPIRWMAPESLTNNIFSAKSTVWSFGVLVWEMFSYGLQPYCGYSNQEVLDMVTRFQLLSCPDQCPARVYALMHECWSQDANLRPAFKDIYAKLCGWEGTNATRMTSQLARGIHRQLTNIMREGQYGQYSSGDSASIPSYTTPSPPPTYNAVTGNTGVYPISSQHQFMPPAAPNVSPASHAFQTTSPATTNSSVPMYPQTQGQRLVVDLQGAPEQQGYGQGGFANPNNQGFHNRYYSDQQAGIVTSIPHRQTHSSRSASSCASSSSEYGPVRPNHPNFAAQGFNQHPDSFQYNAQPQGQQKFYGDVDYPPTSQPFQHYQQPQHQVGYSQSPRRPLSGVMEEETAIPGGIKRGVQTPSATVAPYSISVGVSDADTSFISQRHADMSMSSMTDSSQISDLKVTNKDSMTSQKGQIEETESSSSTSSSVKATSCDSGLPVDEETELLVSNASSNQSTSITSPLLAPKPYIPKNQLQANMRKTPSRGVSERSYT